MSEMAREEGPSRAASAKEPTGPRADPGRALARRPQEGVSRRVSTASAPTGDRVPAPAAPAAPAARGRGGDHDGGDDQLIGEIVGGLLGAGVGAAAGGLIGGVAGAIIGGVLGAVAGAVIGHLVSRKTVTINVTRLSGVADTVSIDVVRANQVYQQANVRVDTGTVENLNATASNAILGADGALDNFSGNSLTAEETRLVGRNRTPGRITAYYVPRFRAPGLRGEAIRPSRFGVADPSVVVGASTRVLDTLAHELGHVLTNDGSHPSDASNLMARGGSRNFTDNLTSDQISKIRSSPYAR